MRTYDIFSVFFSNTRDFNLLFIKLNKFFIRFLARLEAATCEPRSFFPIVLRLINIEKKLHIVVPYHQGLSESYKNICKQYGIDVHLKGGHTIKDHLMSPKDKDPINKKVVLYTGLSVTWLIVMMNIFVSQLEILKRG